MERLTKRTDIGIVGSNDRVKNYPLYKVAEYDELDHGIVGQCFDKLCAYEDLEEQGLMLRLPCKVGDKVYLIKSDGKVVPRTADMQFLGVLWDDYGKEWFLTQEEAEQKLKEIAAQED